VGTAYPGDGDVPTSCPDTGARTLAVLRAAGCRVVQLPELSDVDTWEDAIAVAADVPVDGSLPPWPLYRRCWAAAGERSGGAAGEKRQIMTDIPGA
jgi:hypothetical protein